MKRIRLERLTADALGVQPTRRAEAEALAQAERLQRNYQDLTRRSTELTVRISRLKLQRAEAHPARRSAIAGQIADLGIEQSRVNASMAAAKPAVNAAMTQLLRERDVSAMLLEQQARDEEAARIKSLAETFLEVARDMLDTDIFAGLFREASIRRNAALIAYERTAPAGNGLPVKNAQFVR